MLRGHPFAALHDTRAAVVPCIDEAALNALSTTDYAGLRAGGHGLLPDPVDVEP
jgi:hypothetical protein